MLHYNIFIQPTTNTKTCLPVNNCVEYRKAPLICFRLRRTQEKVPEKEWKPRANSKRREIYFYRPRRTGKIDLNFLFPPTANRKKWCFTCFFAYSELEKIPPPPQKRLRRKKRRQRFFSPAAKNVARPKSRVALRATSLAVSVAQNGHFDPNVAPPQQRNSWLMPWYVLPSSNSLHSTRLNEVCGVFSTMYAVNGGDGTCRGLCNRITGECACFDGFSGAACERSGCPNDCSDHGRCVNMKALATTSDALPLSNVTTYTGEMWSSTVELKHTWCLIPGIPLTK